MPSFDIYTPLDVQFLLNHLVHLVQISSIGAKMSMTRHEVNLSLLKKAAPERKQVVLFFIPPVSSAYRGPLMCHSIKGRRGGHRVPFYFVESI